MNPAVPTQLGYTPLSTTPTPRPSAIVMGRDVTTNWEAIGFGSGGRPDALERVTINLSSISGQIERRGVVDIDVGSLMSVINSNPNAPTTGFQFALREVSVCETDDEGGTAVEKRMMILASQTYLAS